MAKWAKSAASNYKVHKACSLLCHGWTVLSIGLQPTPEPRGWTGLSFLCWNFWGKKSQFLQSAIESQQNGCYLMSRSTPGTLCLSTWSAPGTVYLNAQSTPGTKIKFLEHSGSPIKSTRSAPSPQTNKICADCQLLIIKKWQAYPSSLLWYRSQSNRQHSSSAAQHWTRLTDFVIGGCTPCSLCQNMGVILPSWQKTYAS